MTRYKQAKHRSIRNLNMSCMDQYPDLCLKEKSTHGKFPACLAHA